MLSIIIIIMINIILNLTTKFSLRKLNIQKETHRLIVTNFSAAVLLIRLEALIVAASLRLFCLHLKTCFMNCASAGIKDKLMMKIDLMGVSFYNSQNARIASGIREEITQ